MATTPNITVEIGIKLGRGFEPVISFDRFDIAHEDRKVTASRLQTDKQLEHVQQFWLQSEAELGDWIILHPNGNSTIMSDQDFLAMLKQ